MSAASSVGSRTINLADSPKGRTMASKVFVPVKICALARQEVRTCVRDGWMMDYAWVVCWMSLPACWLRMGRPQELALPSETVDYLHLSARGLGQPPRHH